MAIHSIPFLAFKKSATMLGSKFYQIDKWKKRVGKYCAKPISAHNSLAEYQKHIFQWKGIEWIATRCDRLRCFSSYLRKLSQSIKKRIFIEQCSFLAIFLEHCFYTLGNRSLTIYIVMQHWPLLGLFLSNRLRDVEICLVTLTDTVTKIFNLNQFLGFYPPSNFFQENRLRLTDWNVKQSTRKHSNSITLVNLNRVTVFAYGNQCNFNGNWNK